MNLMRVEFEMNISNKLFRKIHEYENDPDQVIKHVKRIARNIDPKD